MEQTQRLDAKELPVADIFLKSNSQLNLTFDFSHQPSVECFYRLHLDECAKFTGYFNIDNDCHNITIELHLHGNGASAKLHGIYQLHKQESILLTTRQYHHAPHTTSNIYIKGVMYDASQVTYKSTINIEKQAQYSQAHQQIKHLLISSLAHVLILPQMQTDANNITCTHGAAASKLNEEQLYYAQSRGISIESAKQILIDAFLNETVDNQKLTTGNHC